MGFLDRFRRPSNRLRSDDTLALMLNPDGSVSAVKAGYLNTGGIPFAGGAFSASSRQEITSTPEGYAFAAAVSVWAMRCIEIRQQSVGRMDWFVKNRRTDQREEAHPLALALHRARQRIIRKHERSQLIWGETFLWPQKNPYGYVSDLRWLNNLSMTVDTSAGYISGFDYMPLNGGRMRQFAPREIVFLKTDNDFDDLRGQSRFESILLEVGIDKDISRATKAYYSNDLRIGKLLIPEHDLQVSAAQEFMDYLKQHTQGPHNAGKPVLMPKNIKLVVDNQRAPIEDDVTLRESVRREICAGFGVPLSIAGAWDDAQYQSAPEQRKSLYEETIIPECENIRLEFNQQVMPYFDDSGEYELDFDPSQIMALVEDAQGKSTIATQQLSAGGLMLNEYRRQHELPELPNGDVFYVPTGIRVVKAEDLDKPAPTPPGQPGLPPPYAGVQSALPGVNAAGRSVLEEAWVVPEAETASAESVSVTVENTPELPTTKALVAAPPRVQTSAEDELRAWEKNALNKGAAKAQRFVCQYTPDSVQAQVRAGLVESMKTGDIRRLFTTARERLKTTNAPIAKAETIEETLNQRDSTPMQTPDSVKAEDAATPEEYAAYWQRYDALMQDIGQAWLDEYMAAVWQRLEPLGDALDEPTISEALTAQHDALADAWVGTAQTPGALTRIMLAGMAAGNQALQRPTDMQPTKAIDLTIDWSLLSQQALEFVRQYAFSLIRRIDDTTRQAVSEALSDWIAQGAPLSDLTDTLAGIFQDKQRAALIASTEATRAYNEGAFERWREAGVTKVKFQTVQDSLVCEVCAPLHNIIGTLEQGWWSESKAAYVRPPVHPGCRCFSRPVVD